MELGDLGIVYTWAASKQIAPQEAWLNPVPNSSNFRDYCAGVKLVAV